MIICAHNLDKQVKDWLVSRSHFGLVTSHCDVLYDCKLYAHNHMTHCDVLYCSKYLWLNISVNYIEISNISLVRRRLDTFSS